MLEEQRTRTPATEPAPTAMPGETGGVVKGDSFGDGKLPPVRAERGAPQEEVDAVVDEIKQRYGGALPPDAARTVPPPEGANVLENDGSDALIGLPAHAIDANSNAVEATAQLQAKGIPRQARLSPEERIHETAFAAELEADMGTMVAAAYQIAMASDYIFEVDAAKKLYSAYGSKGKAKDCTDAEKQVRLTANHALHPAAAAITRLAFLRRLDELALLEPADPKRTLFVTSGGCAGGKGTLTQLVKENSATPLDFGAVWDAAGEGDAQENGWVLAAAQARGLKVIFGFAENNPSETYKNVLGRAEFSGRIVDPVTFVRSYVRGGHNMQAFLASPEYQAAFGRGEASAVGIQPGRFDTDSLADKSKPGYPDAKPMGDRGAIGADDIGALPPTMQLIRRALDLFEEWRQKRIAEGKAVDDYFRGAIVNTLKFASVADADAADLTSQAPLA